MGNDFPVVLCHGLFGWGPAEVGGFPYWGTATSVKSPLRRHVASVGPISSAHDRACELAFQIKGGLVSVYSQLYPRISGEHPVGGEIAMRDHFRPGEWYYEIMNWDHIDIVALPEPGKIGEQARFYRTLFGRLADLPAWHQLRESSCPGSAEVAC